MSDMDARGRFEAAELRHEAELAADTDQASAEVLQGGPARATVIEDGWRPRRWLAAAVAATVVAGAAVAIGARLDAGDERTVHAPVDAPTSSTSATTSTTAAPSSPTTTITPVTAAPSARDGLAVSYLDPPALLVPDVFATVELDEDNSASEVAVIDGGVVVAVDDGASLAVIDWSGERRDVALAEPVSDLVAAGPSNVAYGTVGGPRPDDVVVNAYALSGPRSGQVVARTPVDPNRMVELPTGAIGHGLAGLITRVRTPGEVVANYVDVGGGAIALPATPPLVTIDDADTVRTGDGAVWPLQIGRDPRWPTPYAGPSAPAPTIDGGAVYWTSLGPASDPTADFAEPTLPVIATLHPDGTATWRQLPDDWHVAASDTAGTVLVSARNDVMQLARYGTARDVASAAPTSSTTPSGSSAEGRPFVDARVCGTTSTRSSTMVDEPIYLFARSREAPVPIQVIGDPAGGPTAAFALVHRYFTTDPTRGPLDRVEINGQVVEIVVHPNGNGEALWALADGSRAYLRSRGLDQAMLGAIIGRLRPRDRTDPVPGFDLEPDPAVPQLQLVAEDLNTAISGRAAALECRVPTTGYIYRLVALDGDPIFEYAGVIDRPVPLHVGRIDDAIVVIDGNADGAAPTLADVSIAGIAE